MLHYWSTQDPVRSTADDTRTLSLHVLSSAGFGKSYPFQGFLEAPPTGIATNYKESLQTILDNCILLFVLGQDVLSKSWLPNRLKKLYEATRTFKRYMTDVYEEEKRSIERGDSGGGNLMTSLIRASTEEALAKENCDQSRAGDHEGLTESEIYGNMFVFNFAGHDTTAHTLAFAVVILSAHPSVQDWISEELRHVLGQQEPENWNYYDSFPKLKRCQAVLVSLLLH